MKNDNGISFEVLGARQSLVSKAQAARDAARSLTRSGSSSSGRSQHSPLYVLDSGSTASIRADAASPCEAITPVLRVTSAGKRSPGGSPSQQMGQTSPNSLEATSVFSSRNSSRARPTSAPVQASQTGHGVGQQGVSRIHQHHLAHQTSASAQGQMALAPASQVAGSTAAQPQHRSSASSKERPMSPLSRAASGRDSQGSNAGRAWSSSGSRPLSAGLQMRRSVSLGSGLRGLKVDSAGWVVGPGGKLTGIHVGGRTGSDNGLYQQPENTRSDDLLASMFQHLELNNAARGGTSDNGSRLSTLVLGGGGSKGQQPSRLSLDGLGSLSDGHSASPSMAAGTPSGILGGTNSSPGAASGPTSGPPSSLASSPGAVSNSSENVRLAPSTTSPKSNLSQQALPVQKQAPAAAATAGIGSVSIQGSRLGVQQQGSAPTHQPVTIAPPSAPLVTDRSPRVINALVPAVQGVGFPQPSASSISIQPAAAQAPGGGASIDAAISGAKASSEGSKPSEQDNQVASNPSGIGANNQAARQPHHLAMSGEPDADDWDVSGVLKGRSRPRGTTNTSQDSQQPSTTTVWGFDVETSAQAALQSPSGSGELSQDGTGSNSGPLKKTSHLTLDMSKIKNPYADSAPTQVHHVLSKVVASAAANTSSPARVTSSPKAMALDSTAAPAAISAQALMRLDSPGGRGPMSPLHTKARGQFGRAGSGHGLGRVVTAVGVLKPPLTSTEIQFLRDRLPGAKDLPHRSCEPLHELLDSTSQLSDAFGLDASELVTGFCVHRHTLE